MSKDIIHLNRKTKPKSIQTSKRKHKFRIGSSFVKNFNFTFLGLNASTIFLVTDNKFFTLPLEIIIEIICLLACYIVACSILQKQTLF